MKETNIHHFNVHAVSLLMLRLGLYEVPPKDIPKTIEQQQKIIENERRKRTNNSK